MKKLVLTVLFALLAARAGAVILAGGDGMQNTNAPTGGQGWDYVGRITSVNGAPSSVTYLTNNWFITAYHIKYYDNPTGVLLGGSAYPIDPVSWTRLTNSVGGNADLIMFRVAGGTVALPGLTVRSSATPNSSGLTMIGNGRNREISETTWNSAWEEGGKPIAYRGYKWATGSTKRWGTNTKDADVGLVSSGGSFGITDMFRSDFDSNAGSSEAQGATYDSGGGVFYENGGNWELAGIMLLTPVYSGQPWPGTSVYGNLTYMADMQYYAAQIADTARIDDIDEDGIPDGWEYAASGSTTGVVASADQDGDGFSGTEEWFADTVPTDSNSYFRVISYTDATNVVFSSSSNREYLIESRANLADTNELWQTGIDWFPGADPQSSTNLSAVSVSNGFYRIRVRIP